MTVPASNQRGTPVAAVTGGARRLGRHLGQMLAARGYDIVILYRTSEADARSLQQEIAATGRRARALQLDVSVQTQVASAFEDIASTEGRLDLLVNNVGNYNPQHITALTPAAWDATLATNLSGAFYCCYHALQLMMAGHLTSTAAPAEGSRAVSARNIINIGTAGLDASRANVRGTDYYVSKAGLLMLTRSLAAAYATHNIRVNMVSPGQLENSIDLPPDLQRVIPIGRAGRLDDVAQAVGYLLDAAYVTGVNIDVAGGYRL